MASEACWRKEEEPDRARMSIGIWRRWDAKMVFIRGMYWVGEALETERMRMRLMMGCRRGSLVV